MSTTYVNTSTETFTRAHVKRISYRVATDLKRIQRLYNQPSDDRIVKYEKELIELIAFGYLDTITYGFKQNGKWIEPTLRFTAFELVQQEYGDDPGRIRYRPGLGEATFCSYLVPTSAWYALSNGEQVAFEKNLPFRRSSAAESEIEGFLIQDLVYSANGRGLRRSSVRSRG